MTKTFENSGSEKEFLDIYRREEVDKYVKPSVTVTRSSSAIMKEESKPYLSSEKTIPSWGNTPSVVASFRSKKISI